MAAALEFKNASTHPAPQADMVVADVIVSVTAGLCGIITLA